MNSTSHEEIQSVSENAKADFERDGYLVFRPEIAGFDGLRSAVIRKTGKLAAELGRVQDAWRYVPAVRSLALHPSVIEILHSIFGIDPLPFQTLNFTHGTGQKTHSDTIHFQTRPANQMCGVWIALEATDEHNGALHVYPGSHRLPNITMQDFSLARGKKDYGIYEDSLEALIRRNGLAKKSLYLNAGDAVIWHANLLHGGDIVRDPSRTRYSQVTHYFLDSTEFYIPKGSDLERQTIERREAVDIRTGKTVRQFDTEGRCIHLKLRDRAIAAWHRFNWRFPSFKRHLQNTKKMLAGK